MRGTEDATGAGGGVPQRKPAPKSKVMVYVPSRLHRAVRLLALDEGRSTSDVYVEAAHVLLAMRGVAVDECPGPGASSREPPLAPVTELVSAIERQGRHIEDIVASLHAARPDATLYGAAPAGTKAADAMKAVLRVLKEVGAAGLSIRDLEAAVYATGITSGAVETAKAVLRGAGLVRCEGKRWFVDGI